VNCRSASADVLGHFWYAVRCVDCQGNGAVDAVIAALDWLAGAYVLPAVASLSLGSNSVNAALDTALQSVIALGVTGIVAAGNYQSGEMPPSQQASFTCSVQQQVPSGRCSMLLSVN